MAISSNLKYDNSIMFDDKGRYSLGIEYNNDYLTKRELEVIKHVIQGFSAKKIGLNLGISYRTVESYINMIKLKLRCNRKSDLIAFCIQSGFYKLFF